MKKNLVVAFGGPSVEHDVSVVSAVQAMRYVDRDKYRLIPIYWNKEGRFVTTDKLSDASLRQPTLWKDEVSFDYKSLLISPASAFFRPKRLTVDYVLPIFHGHGGEDGAFQGLIQVMDVPCLGSGVSASAIGMDKLLFKKVMKSSGLPVLPFQVVSAGEKIASVDFPFPVIVKPAHLGSSIGVAKAENLPQVKSALKTVFDLDNLAIIEPFLEPMTEINCSVIGGGGKASQASLCEQPMPRDQILSFADKYLRGGKTAKNKTSGMAGADRRIPAPISKNLTDMINELAIKAFDSCQCSGVARVDFMVDKNRRVYITEINTIPGSLSFYLWEASGLSYRELIDRLVDIAGSEYRQNQTLRRDFPSEILNKLAA